MVRGERQLRILELISKNDIETQADLSNALLKQGYNVTQATISRDIRELGLIKVVTQNKKYKYLYPQQSDQRIKLINLFKESVLSIDKAMNMIVIKTISGSANTACLLIDKLNLKGVVGSLAGDDTIVVIVKTIDEVEIIYNKLIEITNSK